MYWLLDRGDWIKLEGSSNEKFSWKENDEFDEYISGLGFAPENTVSGWPNVYEDFGIDENRISYFIPKKNINFCVADDYHGLCVMDLIEGDVDYIFVKDLPSFISFTKEIAHFLPIKRVAEIEKDSRLTKLQEIMLEEELREIELENKEAQRRGEEELRQIRRMAEVAKSREIEWQKEQEDFANQTSQDPEPQPLVVQD